jgi:uncharacterized protein YdeI (BOF family)
MPDTIDHSETKALPPPSRRPRIPRSALLATAVVGVLAAGAALGAGGTRLAQNWEPQRVMLLQAAPINAMRDDTIVAVKGEVTDIFGNKFVVQDGSGRALVDLGRRGEDRTVVAKGETVTVQGRFDRGAIRAQMLTRADGSAEGFGPPGPKGPKDEMKGPKGPRGPKEAKGPPPPGDDDLAPPPPLRAGRDAPPPPPAGRDAPPPPSPTDGKL